MRKLLAILAAALTVSNATADVHCVYTKTKTLSNYNLALIHPIPVYAEPNVNAQHKEITTPGSYFVTSRKNGFIKLADPKYLEANQSYAFAGWAKASDFDNVAYRNCSAASIE